MRLVFGILFVLSMSFFAFMQWGGALLGTGKNVQSQGELRPEKIKLLDIPPLKPQAGSGVQLPVATLPASTPTAVPLAASSPVASVPAVSSVPVAAPAAVPLPPQPQHPPLAAAVAPAVQTKTIKSCMEWGEFSGSDLARATMGLAGLNLGERLEQNIIEYSSGYWVYIPPLKNKTAVNKKIEQIKAVGIEDYFVVQDSKKWINAISLGVFKTREAAKNYQASLKKKGLQSTLVGERKKMLKFTVFAIKGVDAEGKKQLAALQKDFANSELKSVACKN